MMVRLDWWQRWRNRLGGWSTPTERSSGRVIPSVEEIEARLAPAQVSFAVTQDWGSGFQAELRLVNQPTAPAVLNWKLEFDYPAQISSLWDAKIVNHTGNHYVIQNAGWNSTLAPGSTVAFGFIGSPGTTTATPSGYRLNGQALDGPAPVQLPTLAVSDVAVTASVAGSVNAAFAVSLSAAPTAPVTVAWHTADGSALAGRDYQAASGTVTFAAGQTQQAITILVNSATASGSDRLFQVVLTDPVGATLDDATGLGTIHAPTAPPPPATSTVQFRVTSDWGSGFTGEITLSNPTAVAVPAWKLEFDFAGAVASIWNAQIISHTGNHYVIAGAAWNATLPANGTVSFGFSGSPGNLGPTGGPTNFLLNGSGGGGTSNRTPVATNDTAFTTVNQAVTIAVLANDTDPDGDPLVLSAIGSAQHGTLTANAYGTVTYTPAAGYTGSDTFTYTIGDGHGHTASGTVSVTVSAPVSTSWPARVFAPYVDATAWPTYDFVSAAQTQGVQYFTLAFVVAGPNREPAWGGFAAYDIGSSAFSTTLAANIDALRALGGDVVVSFGGAANQELAQVITDVGALTRAYQQVIDTYHLTHIDFDIEGAAAADRASIDRRSQAIAALQQQAAAAGRPLEVSFTLPVLPSGLTPEGVAILQSARTYGVTIARVNVMAMDYGDSAAPNPQGQMGTYAIAAANRLFLQLQGLYGTTKSDAQLWKMVGITPMIGVNDVVTEVFTPADAQQVLAFAQQHDLGLLSMWSLNRDTPGGSGITQQAFEFSHVFETFTG